MKYVKSISLFFVYPLVCFMLGIWVGMAGTQFVQPDDISNISEIDKVSVDGELSEVVYEDSEEIEPEITSLGQNVLNPSVIQEESEQTVLNEGYFVTLVNDYVTVYHSDRKTIFLFTDILAEELPADVQTDLKNGIHLPDEGKLYDFLENYTS